MDDFSGLSPEIVIHCIENICKVIVVHVKHLLDHLRPIGRQFQNLNTMFSTKTNRFFSYQVSRDRVISKPVLAYVKIKTEINKTDKRLVFVTEYN